jgi:TPP-dependent indolepyruvate ferredoxin oxidoreductase alpha subunit
MAERSFAAEVQKLRHGSGTTLHVEGILAVTKALLQSGVAYVGGYHGALISHLMDVLGDAHGNDSFAELMRAARKPTGTPDAATTLAGLREAPLADDDGATLRIRLAETGLT